MKAMRAVRLTIEELWLELHPHLRRFMVDRFYDRPQTARGYAHKEEWEGLPATAQRHFLPTMEKLQKFLWANGIHRRACPQGCGEYWMKGDQQFHSLDCEFAVSFARENFLPNLREDIEHIMDMRKAVRDEVNRLSRDIPNRAGAPRTTVSLGHVPVTEKLVGRNLYDFFDDLWPRVEWDKWNVFVDNYTQWKRENYVSESGYSYVNFGSTVLRILKGELLRV